MAQTPSTAGSPGFPKELQIIEKWAKQFGKKTERSPGGGTYQGQKVQLLIVHHGAHPLLVFPGGDHVLLLFQAIMAPEEAKRVQDFIDQRPDDWQNLRFNLQREMLQGRGGYSFAEDTGKFLGFKVEQAIAVNEADASAAQRFADGVQELIVTGMRGLILFGAALNQKPAAIIKSAPHDAMYT